MRCHEHLIRVVRCGSLLDVERQVVALRVDPHPVAGLDLAAQELTRELVLDEAFRRDLEGQHDQIEEWDFRGGRIFVTVGSYEDEFDPNSGHGWMCRLADSGVLGIAGFARVRKPELELELPD